MPRTRPPYPGVPDRSGEDAASRRADAEAVGGGARVCRADAAQPVPRAPGLPAGREGESLLDALPQRGKADPEVLEL